MPVEKTGLSGSNNTVALIITRMIYRLSGVRLVISILTPTLGSTLS